METLPDVIMVYPKTGFDVPKLSVDLPLSVLSASSLVSSEFEVSIIDQRIESDWRGRLLEELKDRPLLLGISSMTGKQIRFGLEAARLAHESGYQGKIVWGGVHPTLLPVQTLENDAVDIVVIGEGEETLRELTRALHLKHDLSVIEGIAFKKKDRIYLNEKRRPLDLNELPSLPYHLVEIEKYIGSQGRYGSNDTRGLIFISSRGCPWECAFCCNPNISKRKWRSIDAHLVYEKISELRDAYGVTAITFHDEEFLVDRVRAEKIADLIGGEMDWWIQARMDRLLRVDIDKLADGGLKAVQPGIESGSERILKMIRKGETVQDIVKANEKLSHTPIVPLYNFMMGFPGETREELNETVNLALDLIDKNPLAEISGFYAFVPYPGTELYSQATASGFAPPETLDGWSEYNRQHLSTPWIQDNSEQLENLMFTSKLIDGKRLFKRLKQALPLAPLTSGTANYLAARMRKKWKNHDYTSTMDVKLIKMAAKRFLS